MREEMTDAQKTIEELVQDGREDVDRVIGMLATSVRSSSPRRRMAAGIALASVAAIGIGVVVFRRRRRQTLAARLQKALPDSMRELPDALKPARVKGVFKTLARPVQRVLG
jgi:uncharacterized protein HemX